MNERKKGKNEGRKEGRAERKIKPKLCTYQSNTVIRLRI